MGVGSSTSRAALLKGSFRLAPTQFWEPAADWYETWPDFVHRSEARNRTVMRHRSVRVVGALIAADRAERSAPLFFPLADASNPLGCPS